MSVSPVRFVPTEAVSAYPRKNIRLGDVPVGHRVEFAGLQRYVVTYQGDDFASLFSSSGATSPWAKDHVATDYGPIEGIFPGSEGGWDITLPTPTTAPTVKLIDAKALQVVRFTDGNVGVRLTGSEEASGGVLVAFAVGLRWVFGDERVTPLGSIQIGGAT
jgi:hypothetical protein